MGSKGDMFLAVEGRSAIRGEANDADRTGQIDIVGWSWGMKALSELAGGGAAVKSSMRELLVRKRVDASTTALMSALRVNEKIRKASITVRKAGSQPPVDYFQLTIENGRITSIDVESVEGGEHPELVERLTFSFERIRIEYLAQGGDGAGGAARTFEAETQ